MLIQVAPIASVLLLVAEAKNSLHAAESTRSHRQAEAARPIELRDEEEKLRADLAELQELAEAMRLKEEEGRLKADLAELQRLDDIEKLTEGGEGKTKEEDLSKLKGYGDEIEKLAGNEEALKAGLAELDALDEELTAKDAANAQRACDEAVAEGADDGEGTCAEAERKRDEFLGDAQKACDDAVDAVKADGDEGDLRVEMADKCAEVERLEGLLSDAIRKGASGESPPDAAEPDMDTANDGGASYEHDSITAEAEPETIDSSLGEEEIDVAELALALKEARRHCNQAEKAVPSEDWGEPFQGTEAEIEATVSDACCIPPFHAEFCTPTKPPEQCSGYIKCLEADRIGNLFLEAIESEIGPAQKKCDEAVDGGEEVPPPHEIEMKCCLPPYVSLVPACVDADEREVRRIGNKCSALEGCLEVAVLKDLWSDTVGFEYEERGEPGQEGQQSEPSAPEDDSKSGLADASAHDDDGDRINFSHFGGDEGIFTYIKEKVRNRPVSNPDVTSGSSLVARRQGLCLRLIAGSAVVGLVIFGGI